MEGLKLLSYRKADNGWSKSFALEPVSVKTTGLLVHSVVNML